MNSRDRNTYDKDDNMMTIDLYTFQYNFRYTSREEQLEIKDRANRAKWYQTDEKVNNYLYPFSNVQLSTNGMVYYDVKNLDQVNGEPLLFKVKISEESNKDIFVSDFILCHVYLTENSQNIYLNLEKIIPEFIVVKKPEMIVTCILKKLTTFTNIDPKIVDKLYSISSEMSKCSSKNHLSKLIVLPYFNINQLKLNSGNIEQFLNIELMERIFGRRSIVDEHQERNVDEKRKSILNSDSTEQENTLSNETSQIRIANFFEDYENLCKCICMAFHATELISEKMEHYEKLCEFEKRCKTKFLSLSKMNDQYSNAPLLLRTAFTHSSYAQEKELRTHSYERLEFLGDALLHVCAASYIFGNLSGQNCTHWYYGDWYELFSLLIRNKELRQRALELNMDQYILLPRSPKKEIPQKMLADLFESLLGAIFLLCGYEEVYEFIVREYIREHLPTIEIYQAKRNIKKEVNEDAEMIQELSSSQANKLNELEEILNYRFKDKMLLLETLVDYTYNDSKMDIPLEKCDTDNIKKMIRLRKKNYPICKDGIQDTIIIPDFNRFNNERLKFLGIAICKFLTVEHVYTHFPDAEPHQMTLSVHAILDHSDICIQHAIEELKIKDYVLHKSSSPNSSLPDCLFALIGAIFVDSGYNFSALVNDANSSNIVSKYILSTFDKERHMHPDYIRSPVKHYTQHLCQLVFGQVPKFEFIQNEELKNESNDQIDWIYKCTISCQDLILAEHKGMNRKLVEREACHIAIKELSTRTGNNESENSLNDT